MLEELYIDGYRHFRNCTIPFRDIQILAGRNGAGKTAAIELLAKLRDFLAGRDKASLQPCSVSDLCSDKDIPRWDRKEYGKYATTVEFAYTSSQYGKFTYGLKIEHNFRDDTTRVLEEKVSLGGGDRL